MAYANVDMIAAAEFFKGTEAYKKWVFRGNCYKALADGYWETLNGEEVAEVRAEWSEIRLEKMFDSGAKLAQDYLATIAK